MYIINKKTRYPTSWPYEGPACEVADIPRGKVYRHVSEAIFHAKKLTLYNPVGFVVIRISADKVLGKNQFNHEKVFET